MYKKKVKKESEILKHLREQREKEWEEALNKTNKFGEAWEKREEFKRLKEKHGIKEQRETS